MSTTDTPREYSNEVPEKLQSDKIEARLVKSEIWDRLNKDNEHFMGVMVGREGKGKSWTALKIAELVDPGMNADQIVFEPSKFLSKLREWKEEGTTQGRMIVIDEAGVGTGNRTWYEKDQIKFAQILQLVRSENMGIIFTVPRAVEVDSQVRKGRLHALMKILKKKTGEYAELSYYRVSPTRGFRDEVYQPKPTVSIGGIPHKVHSLRFGPPSMELVEEYEEKKNEFQRQQYEEAEDGMTGDEDGEELNPVEEAVQDMKKNGVDHVLSTNNSTGEQYISHELIGHDYGLSKRDARTAKKIAEREIDR